MKSGRLKLVDQGRQGRDGRLSVASAVVHQDDTTLPANHAIHDAPDDPLRLHRAIVTRVDVHATDQIAEPRSRLDDMGVGVQISEMHASIRWPEQIRLDAYCRLQDALGCVQLDLEPLRADLERIWMREGVVADIVTLGVHSPDQIRRTQNVTSDQVEGRVHALVPEDVEDPPGESSVRSIVKCERDGRRIGRPPDAQLTAKGRLDYLRTDHESDSSVVDNPAPAHGVRPRRQQRPLHETIVPVTGGDALQSAQRELIRTPPERDRVPYARILKSETPDCDAGDRHRHGGPCLIERGHAVEQPDPVPSTVISVVAEVGDQRILVEFETSRLTMQDVPRPLHGYDFAAAGPTDIARERSDRDDQLGCWYGRDKHSQMGLKPSLRCRRARSGAF